MLPLERGTALGRYVVDGVLGAGAMGVVYVAYDPELDRKVALKLLRPTPGEGPGEGERLLREARAMARLAHPNVVAVHDVGVHDGQPFLAMEFVEGITLSSWLRREARPVRRAGPMLRKASRQGRARSPARPGRARRSARRRTWRPSSCEARRLTRRATSSASASRSTKRFTVGGLLRRARGSGSPARSRRGGCASRPRVRACRRGCTRRSCGACRPTPASATPR